MLNSKIEDILNAQINKEFYSAYLYLGMSAFFERIGLKGFANWTKIQAKEEMDHGMIIFNYINEREGHIDLRNIEAPDKNFENPLSVFESILEHEKKVTESIECVADLSDEECDKATREFIDWYIAEQVEEEHHTVEVIKKLKMFGTECSMLYHLDKELAERKYTPVNYN